MYIYTPGFLDWPDYRMLLTSLATMRLHSNLDLALLLHVDPNRLTMSSSHRRGGLPRGLFRSLGYHSTTARVHLLSVNLATCPAQRNLCFRYSAITSFTPLRSRITSLRICSRNDIPNIHLSMALCVVASRCSSLFVVAHVSLAYSRAGKTVLLKRLARRVLSSLALSTSFIAVNAFHPALILREISASMSRPIFTVCPR